MHGVINASCDKDNEEISMIPARDKMFGAIDHPVTTITPCSCCHAADIRPGIWLSHCQCIHFFTANSRVQITFNLVIFTSHQNILRASKKMCKRHRPAAKFALQQRKFNMVEPTTANRLWKIGGIKPHSFDFGFDLFSDIFWHIPKRFNFVLERIDFLLNKTAHRFDNHILFGRCSKLHI